MTARIIFIPEIRAPRAAFRVLFHVVRKAVHDISIIKKRNACDAYAKYIIRFSEIMPYPMIRNLDEKLGISLAWKSEIEPSIKTKLLLIRKLRELTPSDIQSIINEYSAFFNIPGPTVEDVIASYLKGELTEEEFFDVLTERFTYPIPPR